VAIGRHTKVSAHDEPTEIFTWVVDGEILRVVVELTDVVLLLVLRRFLLVGLGLQSHPGLLGGVVPFHVRAGFSLLVRAGGTKAEEASE